MNQDRNRDRKRNNKGQFTSAPSRHIEERFWEKVGLPDPQTSCMDWRGTLHVRGKGYGRLGRGRRGLGMLYTHRFAYEWAYGRIPDGFDVLHTCDNPRCVNPLHLFVGTASDNALDAARKGRLTGGYTEEHPFEERNVQRDQKGRFVHTWLDRAERPS